MSEYGRRSESLLYSLERYLVSWSLDKFLLGAEYVSQCFSCISDLGGDVTKLVSNAKKGAKFTKVSRNRKVAHSLNCGWIDIYTILGDVAFTRS